MHRRNFLAKSLFVAALVSIPFTQLAKASSYQINIRRVYKNSAFIIGEMAVNGKFLCYTMDALGG